MAPWPKSASVPGRASWPSPAGGRSGRELRRPERATFVEDDDDDDDNDYYTNDDNNDRDGTERATAGASRSSGARSPGAAAPLDPRATMQEARSRQARSTIMEDGRAGDEPGDDALSDPGDDSESRSPVLTSSATNVALPPIVRCASAAANR